MCGLLVAFCSSYSCLLYFINHCRGTGRLATLPPLKGSRLSPLLTDSGICCDNVFRYQRIGIKHTPIFKKSKVAMAITFSFIFDALSEEDSVIVQRCSYFSCGFGHDCTSEYSVKL